MSKHLYLFDKRNYTIFDNNNNTGKLHDSDENKENGKTVMFNISNLPPNSILFKINQHEKLVFLKNKKCADYLLFEPTKNNKLNLHIFELKSTLRNKNWEEIKEQFLGAFYMGVAIVSFIYKDYTYNNIEDTYTYSIILKNKFKKSNSNNCDTNLAQEKYKSFNKEDKQNELETPDNKILKIDKYFNKPFNNKVIKLEEVNIHIDFTDLKNLSHYPPAT